MKVSSLIVLPCLLAAGSSPAAGLDLGRVLGDAGGGGFRRAEAPRAFQFPADHGAHVRYRSEWWYVTASLETPGGRAFGVQFTLFRQALAPRPVIGGPWDASQLYLAHLAVTDVAARRHRESERIARAHPRLAGVSADPFVAHLDGWRLAADGPGLAGLRLNAADRELAVDVRLEPRKPIVLQGDRGLSAKGPDQASYYYSLPRLSAAGTVRSGDRTFRVTGTAWLDREWSTSVLGDRQVGWDWFGLHLDTGEDMMVFQLRNRRGVRDPYDQGVWVDADGRDRQLRGADFTLEPFEHFDDGDGVRWPVGWHLTVVSPEGPRRLTVRAALDDQRMDTLLTYWEGLVRVLEDGHEIGTGYMELTGYD